MLEQILGDMAPQTAMFIILNLILLESLLSIDNAAVLAAMVRDLPPEQRVKALRYGIFGAYFFRGLCLVFSAWLIQIAWLKVVGGLYLIYLTFKYFKEKREKEKAGDEHAEEVVDKEKSKIYQATIGRIGPFWATVASVELMDLAFSIDNVFAAVAFSDNIYLICIGVFIGILAMRFAAQFFVHLLERFPFMETTAFIVIGILGVKLTMSYVADATDSAILNKLVNSHSSDMWTSITTVCIFVIPIITSALFNIPKRAVPEASKDAADA